MDDSRRSGGRRGGAGGCCRRDRLRPLDLGIYVKPRPRTPYRLVLVEWEDSARPIDGWQWVEDYELPEILHCISVGYLIAETKSALALAPNLGDVGKERTQASGIIRLPRSAIRRVTRL
jgi:hypothetical protein